MFICSQMTEKSGMISLGDLFDAPSYVPAANQIKAFVTEYLPSGWREWLFQEPLSFPRPTSQFVCEGRKIGTKNLFVPQIPFTISVFQGQKQIKCRMP